MDKTLTEQLLEVLRKNKDLKNANFNHIEIDIIDGDPTVIISRDYDCNVMLFVEHTNGKMKQFH